VQAGTIRFNGADLSQVGKVTLRINRTPDPAPPAAPTRQRVSLTVAVRLDAADPSTLQARLEYLQATMQVREGILRSESGRGHQLEWLARPTGDSLAQAITGRTNHVELTFEAFEAHSSAMVESLEKAVFTPAGGSPIHLHALNGWDESVATERISLLSSMRTLTTTTIAFTARYSQANPADAEATRHAALQTAANELRALDSRYGTLVCGGRSHTVRVRSLQPRIDEARGVVDVNVECFYTTLPGSNDAIVEINESVSEDEGSGERGFAYSGTITADDEAVAIAHFDALVAAKAATGRRLAKLSFIPSRGQGGDAASEEWIGTMPFSFEYRLPQDGITAFRANTSDTEDEAGRKVRVGGEIRGRDLGVMRTKALAIVNTYGVGKEIRSEETIEYVTEVAGGAALIAVMKFSHDFLAPAVDLRGSIEYSENRPSFGEHTATYRGTLAGPTLAKVTAAARSLIPAGTLLRTESEQQSDTVHLETPGDDPEITASERSFTALSFTYTWHQAHTELRIRYTDRTVIDEASMTQERTIEGTAHSTSIGAAATGRDALLTALSLSAPSRSTDSAPYERGVIGTDPVINKWISLDFSRTYISGIEGTPGNDIIEANVSVQRTGAINRPIVHAIPYSRPVAQVDTGWTPGRLLINARCKARLGVTAREWVQGHRSIVTSLGTAGTTRFETDPPQEGMDYSYVPFDGVTVRLRDFTGRYGFTFTELTAMDGVWPVSLVPIADPTPPPP